jgi:hypothetical protein
LIVGALLAGNLSAQAAPVRLPADAPFLKEPAGLRLGLLRAGTRVVPGKTSAGHVEVMLRGWIVTASTRPDRRGGFDLSARAGESIRAEPNGTELGRVVVGALLNRISARGGWTEVRRTGWIPASALPQQAAAARPPAQSAARPPTAAPPNRAVAPPTAPPAATPPRADSAPGRESPERRDSVGVRIRQGAVLQQSPDGAALATLSAPLPASVAARDGDWVKLRVEAWVKRGDVEGELAPPPAITAAMVREHPERYVGQSVEWRVQFLAHQQADELRPEMPRGSPYLLVRGPLPETGFVYVLLTHAQADQLQGLRPLAELTLTATVRAARTRYLATPVVELLRVEGR